MNTYLFHTYLSPWRSPISDQILTIPEFFQKLSLKSACWVSPSPFKLLLKFWIEANRNRQKENSAHRVNKLFLDILIHFVPFIFSLFLSFQLFLSLALEIKRKKRIREQFINRVKSGMKNRNRINYMLNNVEKQVKWTDFSVTHFFLFERSPALHKPARRFPNGKI